MIDRVLSLSSDELTDYLRDLLSSEDAVWQFDDFDDALLKTVEERPEEVDRICTQIAALIAEMPDGEAKLFCKSYGYNTAMAAAFFRQQPSRVDAIFSEGLAYCKEHALYEAGKSLIGNMIHMRKSASLPADEMLSLLRISKDFYVTLGRHKDAVETLCDAATQFADVRAFQSAYRAINDAQEIVAANDLPREQVRILETNGMVALMEGDLSCAAGEFKKCLGLLDHLGEPASFELRSNDALVKLRSERYESAAAKFQSLLEDFPTAEHEAHRRQILVNMLVCRRETGDEDASMKLVEQIDSILSEIGTEQRIEAQLVVAKTFVRFEKASLAVVRLQDACFQIQRLIDPIQRLHYRRGVRENYLGRIRAFLGDLPESGKAADILPMLALCSSNSLLDWFSALQWCDEVDLNANIPEPLKAELRACVEELVRFGTPFLYGFREKYDDPFDMPEDAMQEKVGAEMANAIDHSGPWRRLNATTDKIRRLAGLASPFDAAKLEAVIERLRLRLKTGSAFLFSLVIKEGCGLFLMSGDDFRRLEIPLERLKGSAYAIHQYQRNTISRREFRSKLRNFETDNRDALSAITAVIENDQISELVVVSDYLTENITLLPAIMASDKIRARIRDRKFVYRACSALWTEPLHPLEMGPCVFIHNSDQDLELAQSEIAMVRRATSGRAFIAVDLNLDNLDFAERPLSEANILHLSTHSVPADSFTDPMFVSTATRQDENSLWLESIQREARRLKVNFAFLNGCNTGTSINWNYFKKFSTNEQVGIASAILLNRRSVVVASHWNVVEMAAYAFSYLLHERLKNEPNPTVAFITALADLYDLSRARALEIFNAIEDEDARRKRVEALTDTPVEFPFRDPYFLGMFQLHSLLVD